MRAIRASAWSGRAWGESPRVGRYCPVRRPLAGAARPEVEGARLETGAERPPPGGPAPGFRRRVAASRSAEWVPFQMAVRARGGTRAAALAASARAAAAVARDTPAADRTGMAGHRA